MREHAKEPWFVHEKDDDLVVSSATREYMVPICSVSVGFNEPFESEQQAKQTMGWAQKFAMSKYATKEDREAAINAKIDQLAKKRDHAADVCGNVMLSWSYQHDIDQLVAMLTPNM